jgi:flagellar biosynthesis regulator FlaF
MSQELKANLISISFLEGQKQLSILQRTQLNYNVYKSNYTEC